MQIKKFKLSELKIDDRYVISRPLKPEFHKIFLAKFPNFPPITVNGENMVISGHDSYEFMKNNGKIYSEVIVYDTDIKNSLYHAYNFREIIAPLNMFEKLFFLRDILKHSDIRELYERTKIGIKVDDILIELLPILTGDMFRDLLSDNLLSLKAATRICSFKTADRIALARMFSEVRCSNSSQLIILDMISEICFRDKSNVEEVLRKIGYNDLCSNECQSTKIVEALHKLRFPLYSEEENRWSVDIQNVNIPYRFRVNHSPFFEKKGVELTLFLDSLDVLKEVTDKIRN